MTENKNTMVNRILVIDDNPNIFDDFKAILQGTIDTSGLDALNSELFGNEVKITSFSKSYQLDYASQGKEGYEKVKQALRQEQPYQLAFVDMRMPPGWDGLETIEPIWQVDPHIQIVICTAYYDYSWEEITERLGVSDNLLILKKPFDVAEVAQLASALTEKWHLKRQAGFKLEEMEQEVKKRTRALLETKERLRESERFLSVVFDSIQNGISVLDPELNIVRVNQTIKDWYAHVIPLEGKKCYEAYHGRSKPCDVCPTIRAINTGKIEMNEVPLTQADGVAGALELFAFPMRNDSGKVTGVVEHVSDITERKRLEAQLQQSHKMEAIGTLTGGIAHDFNNILGIILGNLELALDDVPEWNRAKFNLEEIRTASLRAKDVVRQLLSFARKTGLEKKPTNIVPIVKESLKLLRSSLPTSIEIFQNITKDVDTILADPTQINQVLINLCTNADHAMPDGGMLEVSLKNVELDEDTATQYPDLDPGRYVNLTVSDTGQGINPEFKDRIFDPYFTTKEVGKGTGMGLSVVHGIVKSHRGAISVDSEFGRGTAFSIFFPVVEEEAVIETDTIEELPTGSERILFVDDEESMVYIGRNRLERFGYKIEAKTSPVEALELFRNNADQFDLVITDMTMPQMTGVQLAQKLLEIRPDIPIIICTGFSAKVDGEKAKKIGIRQYIEKPLNRSDLAKLVRKVLDEK